MYLNISDEIKYPRLAPLVKDICLWLRTIGFQEKLTRYIIEKGGKVDQAIQSSLVYGYPPGLI